MSDDTKPSARAIAAGKAISDRLLEVTYLGDRDAAGIIDQHFRAHDELLAAVKAADTFLADSAIATPRIREHEALSRLLTSALVLAEPERLL